MTVGRVACALPLHDVVETMRPLPIEPLADAPPFVVGLSRIRGEAVVVVDLRRLIGTEAVSPAQRLVLVRAADRRVALLVDACPGVRHLDTGDFSALPPLLRDACGSAADALGSLDRQLCLVLESARILPRERNVCLVPS